jgi:hypothetical protein
LCFIEHGGGVVAQGAIVGLDAFLIFGEVFDAPLFSSLGLSLVAPDSIMLRSDSPRWMPGFLGWSVAGAMPSSLEAASLMAESEPLATISRTRTWKLFWSSLSMGCALY